MRILLLLLVAILVLPVPRLAAQDAEAEVMATVRHLFDGMRAGDSTAVRAAFHPEAVVMTTGQKDGKPVLQKVSIDRFVGAVGAPHDEVWDERIRNPEIRIDDGLATVWMDYAFHLGDRLSHCGTNAFQLFRAPEGWKITAVTDTRRREGCPEIPRS